MLVAGDPEIITLSAEVAAQNDVGAIIYAGATQFTANAISAAKENNSNIITVAIEPERNFTSVEEKADLVITADWGKYADEIVANARGRATIPAVKPPIRSPLKLEVSFIVYSL